MTVPRPRHITYISGTRADFGLMASTLRLIDLDPRLSIDIIATGMHLSNTYGITLREIEATGLAIRSIIHVDPDETSDASMARNIGKMLVGFVDSLKNQRPQCVLLLGDRGEMIAGALAALHLSIPVVHIHGGERSGTVDEPIRHAISKLANIHLVATNAARSRLLRMGESKECIHVVGAPGLDSLSLLATADREQLSRSIGFDHTKPLGLLIYHPVKHEVEPSCSELSILIESALSCGLQILALMPNSDAGSASIRERLLQASSEDPRFIVRTHMKRDEFVSWLSVVDVMLGNSSSGIIEAATFGTPVINIGTRQNMRERNANVIDLTTECTGSSQLIKSVLARGRYPQENLYGDGQAGPRIVDLLATIDFGLHQVTKCNAY